MQSKGFKPKWVAGSFVRQIGGWKPFFEWLEKPTNYVKGKVLIWYKGRLVGLRNAREPEKISERIGRNDKCFCGSGKKFKRCHGKKD